MVKFDSEQYASACAMLSDGKSGEHCRAPTDAFSGLHQPAESGADAGRLTAIHLGDTWSVLYAWTSVGNPAFSKSKTWTENGTADARQTPAFVHFFGQVKLPVSYQAA